MLTLKHGIESLTKTKYFIFDMHKSIQTKLTILNKLGLHARAAAKLAATASRYSSVIMVGTKAGELIDAKSVMSLLLLAANNGATLYFDIKGSDAENAYGALKNLINNKFDEEK